MSEKTFKIAIIGDGCTGKTSYFTRVTEHTNPNYSFNKNYQATQGFNLLTIPFTTETDQVINVDLWDTAGQEIYGEQLRGFIRNSDAIVMFYDVTNRRSMTNLAKWAEDIKACCHSQVPVSIVGNKIDQFDDLEPLQGEYLREARYKSLFGRTDGIKSYLLSVKTDEAYLPKPSWFWNETWETHENGVILPIQHLVRYLTGETITDIEYSAETYLVCPQEMEEYNDNHIPPEPPLHPIPVDNLEYDY